MMSSSFLWDNVQGGSCNNTQLVTSLTEMLSALDCAEALQTTEILIDSYVYISDTIPVADISNLTIRGITEGAALQYNDNLQRRRLLVITNSSLRLESLLLLGDSGMGCLVSFMQRLHIYYPFHHANLTAF